MGIIIDVISPNNQITYEQCVICIVLAALGALSFFMQIIILIINFYRIHKKRKDDIKNMPD